MSTIQRALLIAHDAAPSRAFQALAIALAKSHVAIRLLLADAGSNPTPTTEDTLAGVAWADVVVIGMSSERNAAREVYAASLAHARDKPYGFYADTFGAWKREWFSGFRLNASFLFVVNDEERPEAARYFRNAQISPTGNPEWWKYCVPADREVARRLVNAEKRECVVLVPLTKDPAINRTKAIATIDAVNACPGAFCVVFDMHPGDITSPEAYEAEFSKKLKEETMSGLVFSSEPADRLIPGADVLVGPSTSPSIHAMAREIVVIDVLDPTIEAWLQKDVGDTHTYAGRHGGSFEPRTPREFAELLAHLTGLHMSGPGRDNELEARFRDLRTRQKALVPHTSEGEAVGKMAYAILNL